MSQKARGVSGEGGRRRGRLNLNHSYCLLEFQYKTTENLLNYIHSIMKKQQVSQICWSWLKKRKYGHLPLQDFSLGWDVTTRHLGSSLLTHLLIVGWCASAASCWREGRKEGKMKMGITIVPIYRATSYWHRCEVMWIFTGELMKLKMKQILSVAGTDGSVD